MRRILALALLWLLSGITIAATPFPPGCIQTITMGQAVNGQLTTSDCSYYYASSPQNLYYYDVYTFSASAGQQIYISMTSATMDTYLYLYNVNDLTAIPLAYDDDGGGGTNARIPANSGWLTLPAAGTYYISAESSFANARGTGSYTLTVTTNTAPPPAASTLTVYEFYHPVFNHYFITAYPAEAASLNAGNLPPWVATGQTWQVWSSASSGIVAVCRFFSSTFAPRSSHFYTHNPAECTSLRAGSVWTLEAPDAFYMMPTATGSCASGTIPLYRLYNNGMGGAPNHRYTVSLQIRATMIQGGWIPEGNGPDGVFACVLAGSTPPPAGSAFQQEVTGYADTILGLVNGNLFAIDELSAVLTSAVNALTNPGTTCPVASTNPPLANLTTLPSSLSINASYGSGCNVPGAGTVSGSAVITLTNVAFTDTSIRASIAATFNDIKANNVVLANGAVTATLNLTLGANLSSASGPINVSFSSFQLGTFGVTGSLAINLNTLGTSTLTTNLTTSPHNVVIKLNLGIAPQSDGSVLINTTAASTVGAYSVQVSGVRLNGAVCSTGAVGGTVSFTKGGQTGTLTFNNSCSYVYSGP